jgi:hypothetical protein
MVYELSPYGPRVCSQTGNSITLSFKSLLSVGVLKCFKSAMASL